MTPEEKAINLVDKYRKYVSDGIHNGFYSGEITWNNQKKCALIAVDEMTKYIPNVYHNDSVKEKYWKQVKNEIEKL
jgi:hypothetical protein